MFFLDLSYQHPFCCWESPCTSPPRDALQHCAGLWPCCVGSSDSNLLLLRLFLPPRSTAARAVCFLLRERSVSFHVFRDTESAPWSSGFNLQLVQQVGRFWVLRSRTAPGFQLWLGLHLCLCVLHGALLLRLPWRAWACPREDGVRGLQLLGQQGLGHQVLRGTGG